MTDIPKPTGGIHPKSVYVLGLDVARSGADETAYVVLEQLPFGGEVFVSYLETTNGKPLNETIGRVLNLHDKFIFKKIIVDETGLGSGVTDVLKERLGSIVEGVTFTRNSKVDMFYNLKLLLQQNKIHIPDYTTSTNPLVRKLFFQFLGIQQEFTSNSPVPKISHDSRGHDDLVCSLALACLYFRAGKQIGKKNYTILGYN